MALISTQVFAASSALNFSSLGPGSAPQCQISYDSGNGFGSTNTSVRRFSNSRYSTGSCGTWADSAANGGAFTVSSGGAGIYSIEWHDTVTVPPGIVGIFVNGTNGAGNARTSTYAQGLRALSATGSASQSAVVNWTGWLNVGDVVWFQSSSGGLDTTTTAQSMFTIAQVGTASGAGNWTTYTPTLTNFGTSPGSIVMRYRTVGSDTIEIQGSFSTGTSLPASEARMSLPAGYTVNSTLVTTKQLAGKVVHANNGVTYAGNMLGGDTYVTFGSSGGNNELAASNGNDFQPSAKVSVSLMVPIQ